LTFLPGADAVFFGLGKFDADQLNGAGFFDGGNQTLPGLTGNVEIGVAGWWNGNGTTSYAQALAAGYNTGLSALIPITLVTGTDPNVKDLGAMLPFTVGTVAPEPTTLALCGLGAASLLLFRRKK